MLHADLAWDSHENTVGGLDAFLMVSDTFLQPSDVRFVLSTVWMGDFPDAEIGNTVIVGILHYVCISAHTAWP